MPLESCMLVLDNSEYMRNGDYMPTRFQAQAQAVSTVFTSKTDSNPESAVGLMTMAGKSPSLLVTPTNDIGKLLTAMNKSTIGGLSDLQTSVQIAQLALKHRENKNQRQRIVVFVGSPLQDSQESLVKLGKKLRKNNVLVDIVVFGEEGLGEEEKLGALVEAAGGVENDSHIVAIPPGPHLLSDIIRQSPILGEEGGHGGGGGDESMGMDDLNPDMDPELAMAIRMSLQEAQEASARAAAAQGQAEPGPSSSAQPVPATTADVFSGPSSAFPSGPTSSAFAAGGSATGLPAGLTAPLHNAFTREPTAPGDGTPPVRAPVANDEDDDEDEEAMLARAMALSRGEHGDADMQALDEDEEEDEEAAIARAIQMSLEEPKGDGKSKP